MSRWVHMTDLWTFKPTEVLQNRKHLFECRDSEKGHSLLVKVAATHSGVINGNARFYRPDRMQEGTHTWLPRDGQFARPVLVGHSEKGEVVGRVVQAKYVDESYKHHTDFPILKDTVFYRTDSKRLSLFNSVDWIVDHLQDMDGYSGLGYIELGLNLTNPEAIRKVLADEYLTVSVGFKTDAAVCSICHTDWSQDDRCEHDMGSDVDGKPAFLISGAFDYKEMSFVNFPADPYAGTVSKGTLTDSLNKIFALGLPVGERKSRGLELTDSIVTADIHIAEDTVAHTEIDITNMDLTQLAESMKSPELTAEKATAMKAKLQGFEPKNEDEKTQKRSLVSTLNAKIRKNGWAVDAAKPAKSAEELRKELENKDADTEGDSNVTEGDGCPDGVCQTDEKPWNLDQLPEEDKAFFADSDGLYEEMSIEMDEAVKAGELKDSDTKDAKLSTEKRKGLATGTFCGPNRSFPVPDCAHVTAARRLIGRAKVSADTKKRILSCVSGKASKLGCTSKDAVVPATDSKRWPDLTDRMNRVIATLKDDDATPGQEVLAHYNAIDKAYDKAEETLQYRMEGFTRAMLEDWSADRMMAYYVQRLKEKDMVAIDQKDLVEKDEAVNSLTEDLANSKGEVKSAIDAAALSIKDTKHALASQIVMYRVLKGEDGWQELSAADVTTKVEQMAKRHIQSLKDAVTDILSGLKWVKPAVDTTTPETPTQTDPADKSPETESKVNDNAQVIEPDPTTVTDEQKQKAEKDAERRKQNETDAQERRRLSIMNPRERREYLATKAYDKVAAKK